MAEFKDLTGQRFGRLVVLHRRPFNSGSNKIVWVCQCDCGKIHQTVARPMIDGRTSSCGCLHDSAHLKDMVGQKRGRLTVISRHGTTPDNQNATWLCKCECGKELVVPGSRLRNGNTQSCGCLHEERWRAAVVTHGMHSTKMYRAWSEMKQRCINPSRPNYNNYGGRGIKICDRWLKFENFLADMGVRPEGMTLERKDPDGNYCPENCVWASYKVQASNKRIHKRLAELEAEVARLRGITAAQPHPHSLHPA